MSAEVFIRKLEAFAPLPKDDQDFLRNLLSKTVKVDAARPFLREGDAAGTVHVLLSGMACRYKALQLNKRQISAFIIPGDFCDSNLLLLKQSDHSVATLSKCILAEISRDQLIEALERPNISRSLLFSKLVEESVLREWVANIGQRPARQRIGHLFLEVYLRLRAVGLANTDCVSLPLSQADLGDALGLSLVHTNKSLRALREEKLVKFKHGMLTVSDVEALQKSCRFSSAYLHFEGGNNLTF